MAHNTKPILVDVNGRPIPQYFDPLADEYKPLLGQHGAARSILYGPDGQPIGTSGNPLQVKAHDTDTVLGQIKDALGPLATETKLEAVRTLLASLVGKDFATQTTLAQVKQVLDTLNIAVEDLKSELILVKANQTSGDQKVQLSGTIVEEPVWVYERVQLNTAPGAYSLIEVKAPTGVWGTINYLSVYVPAIGDFTGKHKLTVSVGRPLITALQYSEAIQPVETEVKNNLNFRVDRLAPLKDIIITDTAGVIFRYDNNSDTMQTNTVSIRGIILERRVKQ